MGRAYRPDDMDDTGDAMDFNNGIDEISEVEPLEAAAGSTREDSPETRSVTSRCRIREQLNADVEAFLASGGCISHVEARKVHVIPRGSGGGIGSALV